MLDKTRKGIRKLLRAIRFHGFTYRETAQENLENTKKTLYSTFRQNFEAPTEQMAAQSWRTFKSRTKHLRNTLHNVMASARGRIRAILNPGCKKWVSVAVLDSNTTQICQSLAGKRYNVVYSQIPNKPPRTPPIHPCRSLLLPECNREPLKVDTFKDWLKQNDDEVREWLGPTRYRAWKSGDLSINSFIDLKSHRLWTIEELRSKGKFDKIKQ